MKKTIIVRVVIYTLLVLLTLSVFCFSGSEVSCNALAVVTYPVLTPISFAISKLNVRENICEKGGGEWKKMSSGCVDRCRDDLYALCTQAITDGCDCGPGSCWNGKECVDNGKSGLWGE